MRICVDTSMNLCGFRNAVKFPIEINAFKSLNWFKRYLARSQYFGANFVWHLFKYRSSLAVINYLIESNYRQIIWSSTVFRIGRHRFLRSTLNLTVTVFVWVFSSTLFLCLIFFTVDKRPTTHSHKLIDEMTSQVFRHIVDFFIVVSFSLPLNQCVSYIYYYGFY